MYLTVMPEFTKAQTDIQAMQKQYEDEMKRATDELTKKYTEYQQEQANLPKNIQERRQKELQGVTGKRKCSSNKMHNNSCRNHTLI